MKTYLFTYLMLFALFSSLPAIEETPPPAQEELISPPTEHESPQPKESAQDLLERVEKDISSDDFYSQFIHMLVILGIVIAALFILSWTLKRMLNTKIQNVNSSSLIKVLETRYISSKTAIHFIEVLNKGIIIAESAHGTIRLAELPLDDSSSLGEEESSSS